MEDLFNPPEIRFHEGILLLQGGERPGLDDSFGKGFWHWDNRLESWTCDALRWTEVREKLMRAGYHFPPHDWPSVKWGKGNRRTLRSEQMEAVKAWNQAGGRGVIVMPTGTGKTEVALQIMRENPVPTLVVAPVRDLMYQWHRRILSALGYDAGIIGDGIHRVQDVSVTTYDSATIHMKRLGQLFQLIIWDECHHLPGPWVGDSARMSIAPLRLGLTATLERADGQHSQLKELIGPVVYDLPLKAVKNSVLADYEIRRIPVHLSDDEQARFTSLGRQIRTFMSERKDTGKSLSWEDVCAEAVTDSEAQKVLKAKRIRKAIEDRAAEKLRVIEDIFRLHPADPCIIFVGSNRMARDVSEKFLIPCLLAHCGKRERADILDGMEHGRYKAIVANQVLDEGVDLPVAKVAIVVGGMSSSKQAQQRLGRILRRQGNIKAVLYEVVCLDTGEVARSRSRMKSDAFAETKNHRL
jgi:superfamily II DNA or RNA helicase